MITENFTTLDSSVNLKFRELAFAEYLESKAKSMDDIMSMLQEVAEYEIEEDLFAEPVVGGDGSTIARSFDQWLNDPDGFAKYYLDLITKYRIAPNAQLLTDEGYVLVLDLVKATLQESNVLELSNGGVAQPSAVDVELASASFLDPVVVRYSKDFNPISPDASHVINETKTLLETVNDMICAKQSALAFATAIRSTVDEAVNGITALDKYRSTIASVVASPVSAAVSAVSYYEQLIAGGATSEQIIVAVNKITDNDTVASDSLWNSTLTGSEYNQYLGASPIGPLNLDSVGSVVSTAARIGSQILSGLAQKCLSGIKWVVGKASKYLEEITVNPDDLEVLDGDSSDNTVEQFCFNPSDGINTRPVILINPLVMESFRPQFDYTLPDSPENRLLWEAAIAQWTASASYHKLLGKALEDVASHDYYVYKSVFGVSEFSFPATGGRPTITVSPDYSLSSSDHVWMLAVEVSLPQSTNTEETGAKIQVRPRMVSSWFWRSILPEVWASWTSAIADGSPLTAQRVSASALTTAICAYNTSANQTRITDISGMSESEEYLSLWLSNQMLCESITLHNAQFNDRSAFYITPPPAADVRAISNADFLEVTSGYYTTNGVLARHKPSGAWSVHKEAILCATAVIFQSVERALFPNDFGFIPYSVNPLNAPKPRLRIKRDDENQQAFIDFATTVVASLIVAAAVLTVGFAAKNIARSLAVRRESKMLGIQNKLRSGMKLTGREKRQYAKLCRKGGVASLVKTANAGQTSNADMESVLSREEFMAVIKGVTP